MTGANVENVEVIALLSRRAREAAQLRAGGTGELRDHKSRLSEIVRVGQRFFAVTLDASTTPAKAGVVGI
jgi:hypothetical protein